MAEIQLGRLCIQDKGTGLELLLASSITIAASAEDDIEVLKDRLTARRLNEDSSTRPYLYCNSSLCFSISLRLDAELTSMQCNDFMQTLSTSLQTARLWQQLHFSQPSVQTRAAECRRIEIDLTLTHETAATKLGSRVPHKLGIDVPFYDTRPPPGIVNAALETVSLDLAIRSSLGSKHGWQMSENVDTTSVMCNELCSPSSDLLELSPCTSEITPTKGPILQVSTSGDMLPMTGVEDEPYDDSDSEMLLEAESSNDRKNSGLFKLLDVAIRRSIAESTRLKRDVFIEGDTAFRCLSSVAPAVFRPGYLSAAAGRAVFLPTICQSIGAVSSRRVAARSMEKARHSKHSPPLINHEHVVRLPETLWSVLDRNLIRSMSEQRLHHLSQELTTDLCILDLQAQLSDILEPVDEDSDSAAESGSEFADLSQDMEHEDEVGALDSQYEEELFSDDELDIFDSPNVNVKNQNVCFGSCLDENIVQVLYPTL